MKLKGRHISDSGIRKLKVFLQSKEVEMQDFLKALVKMETPSSKPDMQKPILQFLEKKLNGLGYITIRKKGKETGGYLYSRPKTREKFQPCQLLIGHCDTVWPLGTLKSMRIRTEENKLRGPGVYDMKAGLTQMIFALQAIKELHLKTSVTPVVLINSDEEIGSRESQTVIEKLAKIADRALIAEPPLGLDGKLKTARKGLGRFTILIKGKAAHAGLEPGSGASAIIELAYQVQQLFAMNNPERGITVNVGMIEGGISPNVVAPQSKAVVDVRVLNKVDSEELTKLIYSLKPQNTNTKIEISGKFGRPPMEKTKANQQLWKKAKAIGFRIGLDLEEATAGGGSDGNTTSRFTATLDGLGTCGDGAHAIHEYIFTDKLIERTLLLALLILEAPVNSQNIKNH